MNILINYLASNSGGGKTVAENQIKNLLRLDKKNKYICLFSEGNRILESEYGNCKVIYVKNDSLIKRLWYPKIRIPVLIKDYNVNVLFCPNNYSLYFDKNVKTVIMYQNSNIFFSVFLGKNLLMRLEYLRLNLLSKYSQIKPNFNYWSIKSCLIFYEAFFVSFDGMVFLAAFGLSLYVCLFLRVAITKTIKEE